MGHEAEIRTVSADADFQAMEPGSMIVRHHRSGRAELKTEVLTGGNVLHLALATCVFNNMHRFAKDRGIRVTQASVVADGGFSSDGTASTGIACKVVVGGDATRDDLLRLATDAFEDSTVAAVLKRSTSVELSSVDAHPPAGPSG